MMPAALDFVLHGLALGTAGEHDTTIFMSTGVLTAGGPPLNYLFDSHGPASRPTLLLTWTFLTITLSVCLIIAGLLAAALWRGRSARPEGGVERKGDGLIFIYAGTGISTLALLAMAVYALVALNSVARPPAKPDLTIRVTGFDWWWRAEYLPDQASPGFTTANEIHIPTGRPVLVELESADVIHAFWVPQLAGKTEMIPGRLNRQWLQADTPGIYRGQCTQFCGLEHAHMGFEVVAETPQDFADWRARQLAPSTPSPDPEAVAGAALFMAHCSGCHTVRGTEADGQHGPDLTHLASRRMIAAGTLDNTPPNLKTWMLHPQSIKPGAAMPDTPLSRADANRLMVYLEGLQ